MTVGTARSIPYSRLWLAGPLVFVAGCMVGPKYRRPAPAAPVPPSFKEDTGWSPAQPADSLVRGKWWVIFNDPQLNTLEEKVTVSNQQLKAAVQIYEQAHDEVQIRRSNLFPTLGAGASAARVQESANRPLIGISPGSQLYSDYQIPFAASWELDLWGRIRHMVEASRENAQASAADLENMSLSLHAELADDYFQLRGCDLQIQLLDNTVKAYERSVELTNNRFKGGLASASDLALAQTQLESARAQALDVQVARARYEHAIATLTGEWASTFSLPPAPLNAIPPAVPMVVPSELLQRRPDIASSERHVAMANSAIGVARSAYYPTITLTGVGGVESASLNTLFQAPSAVWSFGAAAAETIFDAGKRNARNRQAQAAYDQAVANYREQVLHSFQDVEDNLAALRILQQESKAEEDAVSSAQHSLNISLNRYKGGLTGYLEVITTQSAALTNQRALADVQTRRMTASVQLIRALGGGWNTTQLPRD